MRLIVTILLVLLACDLFAGDVNRKVCTKGFEQLVILSNAREISVAELNEAALIADTLLRNKCYEYKVDRRGTVYAGASLPYLFGKICGTRRDTTAINAYVKFLYKNTDSTIADEVDYALEELFHTMPELFIQHQLSGSDHEYLLPHIAWGFLNNVYNTYGALNITSYKDVFYKRYPTLKDIDGSSSKIIGQLLSEIEDVIR